MLKLASKPQGFHGDIVEDGFHRESVLGLHPIEEEKRFLPRLQAVEHQNRIFSSGRMRDPLNNSREIGFLAVIQFLGEIPEVLDLGIV